MRRYSFTETQLDISINISQLHAVSKIRHYRKQVQEGNGESLYFNPSVELDSAKLELLGELVKNVELIAINHSFKNFDLE